MVCCFPDGAVGYFFGGVVRLEGTDKSGPLWSHSLTVLFHTVPGFLGPDPLLSLPGSLGRALPGSHLSPVLTSPLWSRPMTNLAVSPSATEWTRAALTGQDRSGTGWGGVGHHS